MTSATLLHSKSRLVSRAQLGRLPAPRATGVYHKPVAHAHLLDALEKGLKDELDAEVTSSQFALARKGATLFGVLTLDYGRNQEYTAALGLRHANDQSLSMQFVAGASVLVCDNLALRGDLIVLKKRHTIHLDLIEEISEGLKRFKDHVKLLDNEISQLKDHRLTETEAKAKILDAFATRSVMPLRLLPAVTKEYLEPRHEEFAPGTVWALHNAFTEVAKELPLNPRMEATRRVGKFLGLTAG